MIDVRLATPHDLPAILEMIRGLSLYHGETAQVTPDQLQRIFFGTAPMGTALIATDGETPLGYAGLTPTMVLHEAKIRIDIHHLFVHEPHRSQGIGTALIQAAKAHAQAIGANRLTIGTDPENTKTIATYRAMDLLEEITGSGSRFTIKLA